MSVVFTFSLGFIFGAVCAYLAMRSRKVNYSASGIAASVKKQQSEKQTRKEKILEILRGRESVMNDDIEKTLNVSDTTATNYLQELEQDGLIEQIGERGRFVSYKLIQK